MIAPVWLAFASGMLIGAAMVGLVAWLVPAYLEWRRIDRALAPAKVIDLATARARHRMRTELAASRRRQAIPVQGGRS